MEKYSEAICIGACVGGFLGPSDPPLSAPSQPYGRPLILRPSDYDCGVDDDCYSYDHDNDE